MYSKVKTNNMIHRIITAYDILLIKSCWSKPENIDIFWQDGLLQNFSMENVFVHGHIDMQLTVTNV